MCLILTERKLGSFQRYVLAVG